MSRLTRIRLDVILFMRRALRRCTCQDPTRPVAPNVSRTLHAIYCRPRLYELRSRG